MMGVRQNFSSFFFSAPLGSKAESQLAKLKTRLASLQNQFSSVPPLAPPEKVDIKSLKGQTWAGPGSAPSDN